ncbi:hypothetical protein D1AOALGA4SA_2282 [Olavius algarvensis Delta 1 endosymbiont]|nr:hypothetical protein D1AOALGA4SA_2282 [Olavius algarvensis Delta 1 endosymbiont]
MKFLKLKRSFGLPVEPETAVVAIMYVKVQYCLV